MDSRARVLSMINAAWTTQVISVACELRLPDLLASGSFDPRQVAAETSASVDAVHRMLRALVTLDLCVENADGTFGLARDGEWLCRERADSLDAWARMSGQRMWANWTQLGESVRTGESARKRVNGAEDFTYLDRSPANAAVFNAAMVNLTQPVARAAAQIVDWTGIEKAVDVGGGVGELIATVLAHRPEMRGVVFDLEHAAAGAREHLLRAGVAERCEVVPGSFFDSVPGGAGAYLLKSVLHNWDDERAIAILRNCAAAMGPSARVMLFERIVPERLTASAADQEIARSDLNMLVGCDGRERTRAQFHALLGEAGLKPAGESPLVAGFSVLAAARA